MLDPLHSAPKFANNVKLAKVYPSPTWHRISNDNYDIWHQSLGNGRLLLVSPQREEVHLLQPRENLIKEQKMIMKMLLINQGGQNSLQNKWKCQSFDEFPTNQTSYGNWESISTNLQSTNSLAANDMLKSDKNTFLPYFQRQPHHHQGWKRGRGKVCLVIDFVEGKSEILLPARLVSLHAR